MTDAQAEALALLKEKPREIARAQSLGFVGNMVSKALIEKGWARADGDLLEITDEGRRAYDDAMFNW